MNADKRDGRDLVYGYYFNGGSLMDKSWNNITQVDSR